MTQKCSLQYLYQEHFQEDKAILIANDVPFEAIEGEKLTVSVEHSRYITQFSMSRLMKFNHLRFATTDIPLPAHLVNKTFTCPVEASHEEEKLSAMNKCFYYYWRKPGEFVDNKYTGHERLIGDS